MYTLELSPPVFSILSSLIEEKFGIHYQAADLELLREKTSARALEAGFDSLLDYYYFLRYDSGSEQELRGLVESLVVNETYFFREWPAIKALVDHFIAPRCSRQKKVRIWSAACATGEEPLSLAMLLDSRNLLDQVEIVASDISARVLGKAQNGFFGKRSIRTNPAPELSDKYLKAEAEGYRISPALISAIQWKQLNLLTLDQIPPTVPFDVILCRNVLIYFSDSTVKHVLEGLAKALAPDGTLLVGVSESLFRYGSAFVGEEHSGSFVYRKAKLQ